MKKKWRLIVRNLPFSATTNQVKELFSKYGNVKNVTLATKSDGKSRGFAFVQFDTKNNAQKAMNELNATQFLERPIAIDWALSKNKYLEVVTKNNNAIKKRDEKVIELKGKKGIENKTKDDINDDIDEDSEKDNEDKINKEDNDNESDEVDAENESNDSEIKKYRRK